MCVCVFCMMMMMKMIRAYCTYACERRLPCFVGHDGRRLGPDGCDGRRVDLGLWRHVTLIKLVSTFTQCVLQQLSRVLRVLEPDLRTHVTHVLNI